MIVCGVAAGAGAVAAAARRDLRALAESHVKLEGRVAALAPAQVDALDAAVSVRLAVLEAAPDPGAAVVAALRPAEPPGRPLVAEPPDPTLAEAEAVLGRHGVGPWRELAPTGETRWFERTSPSGPRRVSARVASFSHARWWATLHEAFLEADGRSGRADDVEQAKRRATIALAALLLRREG